MEWLEFTIEVAVRLAAFAVLLKVKRFITGLFPKTRPEQDGFQTIYPVAASWKVLCVGFGGMLLSLASYLVFSHPAWAAIPASLAAILLLAPPGEIFLDERGITQARLYLFPLWQRSMRWDEVDSAYEARERSGQYSSSKVAVVSAGPDQIIKLSADHVGVEEFLDQLKERRIPIGRLAPRG